MKILLINLLLLLAIKSYALDKVSLPFYSTNESFVVKEMGLVKKMILTDKEKEYLQNKKIRMCAYSQRYPLEFTKNGQYMGIVADIIKLMSQKFSLDIDMIVSTSNQELFTNIYEDKCDMVSIMVHEFSNVESQMNKSIVLARDDLVLITKNDKIFINNINSLYNKKLAVSSKSYKIFLNKHYSFLNIVVIPDIKKLMEKIANNEIYGYFTASLYTNSIVQKYGFNELKVNMKLLDHSLNAGMGVSKDNPQLLSIINKLLQTISKSEIENIVARWSMQIYPSFVDYKLIRQMITFFVLFLLVLLFFYIRQRKFNNMIKAEKNKFENIFYKASDGIAIATNNTLTDCNSALVKNFGYKTKKELLQLNYLGLSPKYQPNGKLSLKKAIEMIRVVKEHGVSNFEWVHLRANGEEFWVDIVVTNISSSKDEDILHIVSRDIQHKKELEWELLELNNNLEERVKDEVEKNRQQQVMLMQHSRLAQMGEMISMIAHQWRQPLAAINSTCATISLKAQVNQLDSITAVKLSAKISQYVQHLSFTIDDFRGFFKSNKSKSRIDYSELITSTLNIIEDSIENKNIKIVKILNSENIFETYPNELKQVLLNLIKNAEDILIEKKIKNPKIIIKTEGDIVTISDNAGGVSENIIDKIFDPYFSTKTDKDGTGLGLYMSKTIVEDHCGGELTVYNNQEGAVFKIKLKSKEN